MIIQAFKIWYILEETDFKLIRIFLKLKIMSFQLSLKYLPAFDWISFTYGRGFF